MDPRDAGGLLALAESIADGSPIDWEAATSTATPENRALIDQLRVVAELATLHRTLPVSPDDLPNAFAQPLAATAPAIGHWAHLDLIEKIGGGTSGDVYRAWDRYLERDVAVKFLHRAGIEDDPYASPVVAEARLLARVRHPHVVTVYGVTAQEGRVGLWMELVDGPTLEQVLQRNGPFSAREAALIGIDLCRALAAIHRAGLLHRDVKTQNVVREQGGRIVLMDLGAGRRMDQESVAALTDRTGTPLYLAPEIFLGGATTERTDIYSLGVLLYRLVTRAFPVRAATLDDLHAAHAAGARVRLRDARPDLPTEFVRVVDRATEPNPVDRPATAGELEAALATTIAPEAAPAPAADIRRRWSTRQWASAVAAIVLTLAIVAVLVFRRTPMPTVTPNPAGRVQLAVLPFQDGTRRADVAHWPELIQALFVDELTGVHDVAIMDPLSMNMMVSHALGSAPNTRNPQLLALLQRANVSLVVEGTIVAAGDGAFQIRINLVDPSSGEARFPAQAAVANEDELLGGVRMLADSILGFLQLQGLPLANDKDLRPWISFRRHNVRAINAFLQASQHIFRYERVAAERDLRRAIELDPTFIEPQVWLIPGLAIQGKVSEARAMYDRLLARERTASPFEQAMIAYAGAMLNGDAAAQARQVEIGLEFLPGNNILLANLAEHREQTGDCAGALAAMRPAVDMRWRYPPLYELWGWCAIDTGLYDEARRVLLDAVNMQPVHPNVYALLEALDIANGEQAAADRFDAMHVAAMRQLDRPASQTYVVKAYRRLAGVCRARNQQDRAARLDAKAAAAVERR